MEKIPIWATVVSYCVSTSNHNMAARVLAAAEVVSYCVSTSDHNITNNDLQVPDVVSYCVSTSNHNNYVVTGDPIELFLIAFLHQTTTWQHS